jgi:hypothetical protein
MCRTRCICIFNLSYSSTSFLAFYILSFHECPNKPFHLLENRGPPGDLYVCLDIEEPSDIKRDGINLYSTVSISYVQAILGTVQQVICFI